MKKKLLLFLMIFLMPLSVRAVEISEIDMDIKILKDGSVEVVETWDYIDSKTVYLTKTFNNYKYINSELKNISVSVDNEDFIERKNISDNIYEKYFEVANDISGYIIKFDAVDDERHKVTFKYTISNYVYNVDDSQILYWTLIEELYSDLEKFDITISSDHYKFLDTMNLNGYGYDGEISVVDGKIRMYDNDGIDEYDSVILLASVPLNTFEISTENTKYGSYNDIKKSLDDDYSYDSDYDYDSDYNYDYEDYLDEDSLVGIAGLTGVMLVIVIVAVLISLAVSVYVIIVMWKIFVKAGKPGWAAIVPFYNSYVLFEITWGKGWLFLTMFASIIPGIGAIAVLVITIITYIKLAKSFGKEGGFAVGLIFLNVIFMSILAFDKSQYLGVPQDNNNNNNNVNNNNFNNSGVTMNVDSTNNGNDLLYCSNCGTKLNSDSIYCPNCGTKK